MKERFKKVLKVVGKIAPLFIFIGVVMFCAIVPMVAAKSADVIDTVTSTTAVMTTTTPVTSTSITTTKTTTTTTKTSTTAKPTEKETTVFYETTTTAKEENNPVKYKKLYGTNIVEGFNTDANNVVLLGEYTLTAYCPCSSCCDQYGENRPVDENGYVIVGTASGARAYSNHTIAVDPDIIPYGTIVIIEINGIFYEYVAEDCGGGVNGAHIDIYHDSHDEAWDFGRQYGDVYIIN